MLVKERFPILPFYTLFFGKINEEYWKISLSLFNNHSDFIEKK
tara:strand:+ start:887 stop:1015 length:129 start_codon:yes stop_codon:yes gene_type:complete